MRRNARSVAAALVAAVLVLACVALTSVDRGSRPAMAAIGGLTAFAIDGNTTGPDDWDNPPPGVLGAPFTDDDACGASGGSIDPTALSGQLDDFDPNGPVPAPRPGNVNKKSDLCRVWRAVEYAGAARTPVLYGAWQRAQSGGESTVYFAGTIDADPTRVDDALIEFDYNDAGGGSVTLALRLWNGSAWVRKDLPAGSYDIAVDNLQKPSFGEFALDLAAAGFGDATHCASGSIASVITGTGQPGGNQQLQDFVAVDRLPVSNCGRLELVKETFPTAGPAASFAFTVGSQSGGAIDRPTGAATIDGTLAVPSATTFATDTVIPRADLTLSEATPPLGWRLSSIVCVATDAEGNTQTFPLVESGAAGPASTFPVSEGGVTRCTITNLRPGSLTINKVADPADGTDFAFTTTGAGLHGFTLDVDPAAAPDQTHSDSITFPNLASGVTYTTAEEVPADWTLAGLACEGGASTTSDPSTATVSIDLRPGEDVACTFTDVRPPPVTQMATLVVDKVAAPRDGTDFAFTTTGGLGDFTLDVDPPAAPDTTHASSASFTVAPGDYTVTEQAIPGWRLDNLTCNGVAHSGSTASVTLTAGQVTICTFTNTKLGTLQIIKHTDPAGATGFPFVVSSPPRPDVPFTLADGQVETLTDRAPGSDAVDELVPAGWHLTDRECSGASIEPGAENGIIVNIAPGTVATCTFSDVQFATISATKHVEPPGVAIPPGGFGFDISGDGSPDVFVGARGLRTAKRSVARHVHHRRDCSRRLVRSRLVQRDGPRPDRRSQRHRCHNRRRRTARSVPMDRHQARPDHDHQGQPPRRRARHPVRHRLQPSCSDPVPTRRRRRFDRRRTERLPARPHHRPWPLARDLHDQRTSARRLVARQRVLRRRERQHHHHHAPTTHPPPQRSRVARVHLRQRPPDHCHDHHDDSRSRRNYDNAIDLVIHVDDDAHLHVDIEPAVADNNIHPCSPGHHRHTNDNRDCRRQWRVATNRKPVTLDTHGWFRLPCDRGRRALRGAPPPERLARRPRRMERTGTALPAEN
jgi:hypothetical protein